jgi:hypothetical protein
LVLRQEEINTISAKESVEIKVFILIAFDVKK